MYQCFQSHSSCKQMFEANDPNFERSFKVNADIFIAYECYREIYENRKKDAKQIRLGTFFLQKKGIIFIFYSILLMF